jgi:hypothetical protein
MERLVMLDLVLVPLLVLAAAAFITVVLSRTFERQYLRYLARNAAAAGSS